MNAIFISFDDKYTIYAKALVHSLNLNYPNRPVLLINYEGNNENTLNWIRDLTNTQFHSLVKNLNNLNVKGPVDSILVYDRYYMWTDQFNDYDNVMFLDVDTLVLNDISHLFKTNEFYIVTNHSSLPHMSIFGNNQSELLLNKLRTDFIKYPVGMHSMANAGMFIIPRKYRTQMYLDKLIYFTVRYNNFARYADQSFISLWCHYFNIPISKEVQYNYQSDFTTDKNIPYNVNLNISIHHFSGIKPIEEKFMNWNWCNEKARIYLKDLFLKYM